MSFNPGDWGINLPPFDPSTISDEAKRKAKEIAEKQLDYLLHGGLTIDGKPVGNMTPEIKQKYMEQQADGILQALPSLQAFDPLRHVDHLSSYMNLGESDYKKRIDKDLYEENLDPRRIDIWGKKQGDLERFKCMTIGWGMRGHSDYHFDQATAPDFEAKFYRQCDDLAMIAYRHDLDDFFGADVSWGSPNRPSKLETLVQDPEFCKAYATKALRPEFVNGLLLQKYVAGGHMTTFPEAVAYIYERCRPLLSGLPDEDKVADDSIRAPNASTSFSSLASFSADLHWKDAAAKHEGLKDNSEQLARFSKAAKPVVWNNEEKLQGPCWVDLGRILGREWSTKTEWVDRIRPMLEKKTVMGRTSFYGWDLINYCTGHEPLMLSNTNEDLFAFSKNSVGVDFGDSFGPHSNFAPMRLMVRSEFASAQLPDVELHNGMTQWAITDTSSHLLPHVKVVHGAVYVDDQLCEHAEQTESHIQWARPLPEDVNHEHTWEHGSIHINGHGLSAHGTVGLGTKETVHTIMAVGTTATPITYMLKVEPAANAHSKKDEALAVNDDACSEHFWTMELRADIQPGGLITGSVVFPDIDKTVNSAKYDATYGGLAMYDPPTISVDQTNKTDLKWMVACDSSIPDDFKSFVAAYDTDTASKSIAGPAFTGFAVKMRFFGGATTGWIKTTDGKYRAIRGGWPPENKPTVFLFQNPIPDGTSRQSMPRIPSSDDHQVASMSTEDHSTVPASVHSSIPPATRNMATAMFVNALDVNGILSLGGEVTSDTIQQTSLKYLMAASEYHRGTEETTLFGERKTVHDTLLKDTGLDSSLDITCQTWLNTKLGKATIINAIIHNEEKYAKLVNDEHQDKIAFWWDGGATDCLSQSPAYSKIMDIAFAHAYQDHVPSAKAYKDDTKDWAEIFYNALMTPKQINQMDTEILLTGNKDSINRYSLILNYLDKKERNYSRLLYEAIMQQQIMKLTQGSGSMNKEWPTFIQEFWPVMIKQLKETTDADNKALRDCIKDVEEEMVKDAADNAKHSAGDLFRDNTEFARIIALVTTQMLLARRMKDGVRLPANGTDVAAGLTQVGTEITKSAKVKAWMKAKLPQLKALTAVLIQGITLGQAIWYIAKWKDLNTEQKVVAVTNLVEATIKSLKEITLLVKTLKDPAVTPQLLRRVCIKRWQGAGGPRPDTTRPRITDAMEVENEPILPNKKVIDVQNLEGTLPEKVPLEEIVRQQTAGPEAVETMIKEFDLGGAIVEGVSIACSIVVVVCMSLDIHEEIKNGSQRAGVVAMDIITVTVLSMQAVVGTIAIGLEALGVEMVMMPYAAAGLAIVGGIMLACEMLVQRDPPPPGPDKIKEYIERERDSGFIATIAKRPDLTLEYTIVQSDITMKSKASDGTETDAQGLQFKITIRDIRGKKPHINNWQFRFYAGKDANRAFLNPTIYAAHHDASGKDVPASTLNPFTVTCSDDRFVWDGGDIAGSDASVVKMVKPAKKLELDAATNEYKYPQFEKEIELVIQGLKNPAYTAEEKYMAKLEVWEILADKITDGTGVMDRKVVARIGKDGEHRMVKGGT